MSSQNTFWSGSILLSLVVSLSANAQEGKYKREKPAPAAPTKVEVPAKPGDKPTVPGATAAPAADDKSDKLDISDLEQKYWAPKDTDFTVVQNRTYTKAGRLGVSLMTGPVLNDTFSDGLNHTLKANYYLDERYGFEFTFIKSDLEDSDDVGNFRSLSSGGGISPDYNREDNYIGLGFNWVPIYAKVSLLGKKILYFDLQVTPHVGMSSYLQQTDGTPVENNKEQSSFTYGVDITQYYFLDTRFALRFDVHNRWYKQEVLGWASGSKVNDKTQHTQMFLFGVTFFF